MKIVLKLTVGILLLFSLLSCAEQENDSLNQDLSIEEINSTVEQSLSSDLTTSFEDAYKVVDELPLFGGCVNKACSDEKLIKYIHKNLVYPQEAKSASVEGRMFVQFVIEIDGSVSNIRTVRDIGAGTSESVVALVRSFNDLDKGWSAGIQNGSKVPVMYTLPVSFKLE